MIKIKSFSDAEYLAEAMAVASAHMVGLPSRENKFCKTCQTIPPTVNHYAKITTRGRFPRKYKTIEAKGFDRIMAKAFEGIKDATFYQDGTELVVSVVVAWDKWILKSSKNKLTMKLTKKDIDNRLKPAIDAALVKNGLDDSRAVSMIVTKVHADFECTAICVSPLQIK